MKGKRQGAEIITHLPLITAHEGGLADGEKTQIKFPSCVHFKCIYQFS